MLTPLTSRECLDIAFNQIDTYVEQGVCVHCAITVVSVARHLDKMKLDFLYHNRDGNESN